MTIPLFRLFLGVALAALTGWLIYVCRPILVPLVTALLIAYLLWTVAEWIHGWQVAGVRVPSWVAHSLALLLMLVVIWGLARLIADNVNEVVQAASTYQANLEAFILRLANALDIEELPSLQQIRRELTQSISLQGLVSELVATLSSMLTGFSVVIIYVGFILVERRAVEEKLDKLAGSPEEAAQLQETMRRISHRVGQYLVVKAVVSLLIGAGSWVVMSLIGIDFAGFWAVLIFVLNFIPYIGSFVGVAFPVALTLAQFGELAPFLFALVGLSAVQIFVGSVIEPRMLGRSLNLSPLVILLALASWGSLWGVVGAILCIPITVIMLTVFAQFSYTRPIAILLSSHGNIDPEQPRPRPRAAGAAPPP